MYTKTYRSVVPVAKSDPLDDVQLKWLVAEGMWRAAEADCLVVQSFMEVSPMDPMDVPPKVDRQLGAKANTFEWRVFEAVAQRA